MLKNCYLAGSFLFGTPHKKSDIDILWVTTKWSDRDLNRIKELIPRASVQVVSNERLGVFNSFSLPYQDLQTLEVYNFNEKEIIKYLQWKYKNKLHPLIKNNSVDEVKKLINLTPVKSKEEIFE